MQTSAVSPFSSAAAPGATPIAPAAADGAPFGDLLMSAIGETDELGQQAASEVSGLIEGQGVDIHDAMIATQKADMAFELTLAVRNKAVAAYQQVMGMQF